MKNLELIETFEKELSGWFGFSGMKTVQQRIYPIIKKNRLGIRFESSKKRKMRLSCFGGIIQCSMTFLWVWSLQIWEYIGY